MLLQKNRLASLDFFRGFVMFLLVGETTHLYGRLQDLTNPDSFLGQLVMQLHHHPWNGLRFWDLVQPAFMFIVGVAMVYSLAKRQLSGESWINITGHIVKRCALLFLFGVGLHCVYSGKLVWELWNVLTQLSFTILVAFIFFNRSIRTQFIVSILLLVLTELMYRFINIPGYDQPFIQGHNFGAYMDRVLMGKINSDGWVAINAIPTAAHTMWGVIAGKILQSRRQDQKKVWLIAGAGVVGLIVGYGLDWSGITPIIKRICTSSFVIVSGGWVLLFLAFSYWFIDVIGIKNWTKFFIIVGMNPIFIYLFTQTVGNQWFNDFFAIFTGGFLSWAGAGEQAIHIINALVVWGFFWYLCYWLYKHKVLIKI